MTRILVTGGAGFIGHHLCAQLARDGHDIVVLDDLSTGKAANLPRQAHLVQGDIRDPDAVNRALSGCTSVVHLAAIASVMRYNDDWQEATSVNLGGAVCVMQAAATAGVPVVYASSAAVYGAANDLPLQENTKLVPISGYGADKLACELQARAMAEVSGLASVGLRFFNVYGPGQVRGSAYSGVITTFLDRWKNGGGLDVFGDGLQSRDFIYVGDIVTAITKALTFAHSGGAQVLNVCASQPTTINELIAQLEMTTGHQFAVTYKPHRDGEIRHSLGDGALARQLIDFAPEIMMKDGLAQLVEWFRSTPD